MAASRMLALGSRAPCALRPPAWLPAPPLFARGIVKGTVDDWGRVRGGGHLELRSTQRRPETGPSSRLPQGQGIPGTPAHYRALQQLSEYTPTLSGGATNPLQALRGRQMRLRQRSDLSMQQEMYMDCRNFLMASDTWTYGCMAAYHQKVLDLMGADGWRSKLSEKDDNIKRLENQLKVFGAMTPVELASNHKSVFIPEALKQIAEKSGQTGKFVDEVLLEHDILRADRRWYKILAQFGRPLPKSFEDRHLMAEYDRPYSETEAKLREEQMDEMRKKQRNKKPPRIRCLYFRRPTCGGNRWSTRPPRSYPTQWRMRPERHARLAGVGVHGGGGDRGVPRGNIAKFWTAGGRPRTGS